jgi:uncharacterized protein YaiI (UPF0178 family)
MRIRVDTDACPVVARTDAASNAMTETAIEEAHRPVHELM